MMSWVSFVSNFASGVISVISAAAGTEMWNFVLAVFGISVFVKALAVLLYGLQK